MKISVMGYSGSGKSTLARRLGELYGAEVLHFDAIHWLPGWVENSPEEKLRLTREFLDAHDSWVIDGNYSKYLMERRTEESDKIILLLFGRFSCLFRVVKRYFTYRNSTRPDMGNGCNEKLDFEFIKWVLFEGRTKRARQRYKNIIEKYPEKTAVIKNQRQLNKFYRMNKLGAP